MGGRLSETTKSRIAERNALVEGALDTVRNVAFMVARQYPAADVDDLIQLGAVGAMQAAGKYDATRGIPFAAFAYRRIRGSMLDSMRRKKAVDEREHVHVDGDESADAALPATMIDVEAIHGRIDNERRFARVKIAMRTLNGDQRKVVRLHYLKERTLQATSEVIGVTRPRASQIRQDAVRRLQELLQEQLVA